MFRNDFDFINFIILLGIFFLFCCFVRVLFNYKYILLLFYLNRVVDFFRKLFEINSNNM